MEWITTIYVSGIIISLLVINYILYTRNEKNKISLHRLEIENRSLEHDLNISKVEIEGLERINNILENEYESNKKLIEKLKSKSINYTITPINNYKKWM